MDEMIRIDEGRMKDIFTANQEGESAEEIAKRLKLPIKTVKSILGEENEDIVEFTDSQLDVLARQYQSLAGKTISIDQANKLRKIFKGVPDRSLDALRRKKIPFLSGLALSRMVQKGMPVKEENIKEARWQIEGQLSYDGIRNQDGFHMVINANSEQDAENKAYKELDKARARRKIGPGGGGSVEDVDIESIEKTNDRLQAPSTYMVSEFDPSEVKEQLSMKATFRNGDDKTFKGKTASDINKQVKEYEKKNNTGLQHDGPMIKEKKSAFRLSYSDRYGKHAGFEDADTLADLQNKAANLRKKGFKIDKMGRNTSPIKEANIDVDNVEKKDSSKEKELKIKLDKEKDQDALEKQLVAAQGKINILQQKLENEKNKVVKPEPNKETGEVPLTVGIAHKYLKDKQEKEVKKESMDNYPTSDIQKKKQDMAKDPKGGEKKPVNLGAKMTYESIKGLKNKADKTGMPYSILKKVYDRGMAAWRGGHRPGTTQQQWAFARVNSFVTKSSGTWGGADKDLAKQVRGKN